MMWSYALADKYWWYAPVVGALIAAVVVAGLVAAAMVGSTLP